MEEDTNSNSNTTAFTNIFRILSLTEKKEGSQTSSQPITNPDSNIIPSGLESDNRFDDPEEKQQPRESQLEPIPEERKDEIREEPNLIGLTREPSYHKRKALECEIREDIKKVKRSVEELNPKNQQPITVRLQKIYSQDTKKTVGNLTKRVGAPKIARWTGVSETSARRWSRSDSFEPGKGGRKPAYLKIEEELFNIFKDLRTRGYQVTNQYLIKEARRRAENQKLNDFTGSSSWLDGFKRRNGIVYRKQTRICQKLKDTAKQELIVFQDKFVRLYEEHEYDMGSMVNIDETGITYDNPSNYTLEIQVNFYL